MDFNGLALTPPPSPDAGYDPWVDISETETDPIISNFDDLDYIIFDLAMSRKPTHLIVTHEYDHDPEFQKILASIYEAEKQFTTVHEPCEAPASKLCGMDDLEPRVESEMSPRKTDDFQGPPPKLVKMVTPNGVNGLGSEVMDTGTGGEGIGSTGYDVLMALGLTLKVKDQGHATMT